MNECCRARKAPRITVMLAVLLVCVSCGRGPLSPEDQIRLLIEQAELAAEERELGTLKNLVAEDYADRHGHSKQDIERILQVLFLRHQSIHLLTRIRSIEFPTPERAQVAVLVAMAGQPFPDQDIVPLRADFHRFDLVLVQEAESEWKVIRTEWRRARREDLIPE